MERALRCMRTLVCWCAAICIGSTTYAANAEGRMYRIETRPGIETTVYWEAHEGAKATIFMFPGGGGGFGHVVDGKPDSQNFLVRTVPLFLANDFNVAIFGRPRDSEGLDYGDRITDTHLNDVRAILEFVKKQSSAPIWLIGTSRGTISATFTAINSGQDFSIAGLVLTSSVLRVKKIGAIPRQDLGAIKIPVLVLHHANDGCPNCQPSEVSNILRGLKNAPIKKQVLATGGANPTGDPCGNQHWHGFIGMEKEAVDLISNWIKNPAN